MPDTISNNVGRVRRKRLMALLSVAVSVGLVVWLLSRMDLSKTKQVASRADLRWLAFASVCVCGLPLLATTRWLGVLRAQDAKMSLPFLQALRAVMTANVLNSFLPSKAGDIAKAVYLRNHGGLSAGLGTVLLERLVDLGVLATLGLIGSASGGLLWGVWAALALLGTVVSAFFLVLYIPRKVALPERLERPVAEASVVFHNWRRSSGAIAQTLAGSLAHWALAGLIVCSLVSAFGSPLAWGRVYGLFPIALLAGLVPATISGAGTRDAAFVMLLGLQGLPVEEATLVGLGYTAFSYWLLSLISLPAVGFDLFHLSETKTKLL